MPTFRRETIEDWLEEAGSRPGFDLETALAPIGHIHTRGMLAPLPGPCAECLVEERCHDDRATRSKDPE